MRLHVAPQRTAQPTTQSAVALWVVGCSQLLGLFPAFIMFVKLLKYIGIEKFLLRTVGIIWIKQPH